MNWIQTANKRRFQIKMPPEGVSLSQFPFKIRGNVFANKQLCWFFFVPLADYLQKILVKDIQVIIKKERFNCAESFHFVSLGSKRLLPVAIFYFNFTLCRKCL